MATSAQLAASGSNPRGFPLPLLAPQPFHPTLLLCSSKGIVSAPMPLPPILSFAPDEEKPAIPSAPFLIHRARNMATRLRGIQYFAHLIVSLFEACSFIRRGPDTFGKFSIKQMSKRADLGNFDSSETDPLCRLSALPYPPLAFVSHGGNSD